MAQKTPRGIYKNKMKLYIDTSEREKIVVGLGEKRFEADSKKEKSQMLLLFIDEILKKEKVKINEISEIEVKRGPGSLTGLRVGLSVANTIGWALGIKVNGQDVKKQGPVLPIYEK